MTDDASWESATFRQSVYSLLILIALANVSAHILSARSADRHTPFFSANDRSRWSTVSALVDEGTYAIDAVRRRAGWKSIDMVRHKDREGQWHYYSSKPPLLATLVAGPYYVLHRLTGASLAEQPFAVARALLIICNLVPLAVYLIVLACWVERHGETDFGRIFLVAGACFGTLLTPFAVTLNNHLPAAIAAFVAVLCVMRIWDDEEPATWLFVVAGLAAAFAAANELPALSLLAVVGATLLWLQPRRTLSYFVPAMLVVAAAFWLTNYIAHNSLRPPYAHRQPGDNWYDYPGSYWMGRRQGVDLGEPSRGRFAFHVLLGHHGFFSLTPLWALSAVGAVTWLTQRASARRFLAGVTLGLWLVCLVFYTLLRPLGDRNYGGVAAGFRWLFWLIPLWLMCLLPVADWLAETRRRRALGLILLGWSTVSASIPLANPWSHPWIYRCVNYYRSAS
jgi:hypothetical protein